MIYFLQLHHCLALVPMTILVVSLEMKMLREGREQQGRDVLMARYVDEAYTSAQQ